MSELASFAKHVGELAALWKTGERVVEHVSAGIRKISGFGGKGFRMKEIYALCLKQLFVALLVRLPSHRSC